MATTTRPRTTAARLGGPAVHSYAKGSWGPPAADDLIAGHGRRHQPWVPS